MSDVYETELKRIDDSEAQAQTNLIESDMYDSLIERAYAVTNAGDFAQASIHITSAIEKPIGAGSRLDLLMLAARIGLFNFDLSAATEAVLQAKAQLEKGGDWERRNKLKIYDGLVQLATGNFASATTSFLSGIATFTASEVVTFQKFIFYAVLTARMTLPRDRYRAEIIECPEVKQISLEDPVLARFTQALYKCHYREFFQTLVDIHPVLENDRYLGTHAPTIIKTLRVLGYRQFLSPVEAVSLRHMGDTFGVSAEFLEAEIYHCIVTQRLSCKLDAADGVIISVESNEKGQMLNEVLHRSTLLCDKIQRLFKVMQA
ncbi:MAG: uncharacterized protein KVP18_004520 [Porospora cf. gigantea A]|uniref:uncharacterized protein n=1 Tax=Porospora cf. gigantea A TaxID=2853593 RepID=UPI003559DFE1|nr:MAG: hypothetical protein KVP18_004520 [Porospora cf. gigantea A]